MTNGKEGDGISLVMIKPDMLERGLSHELKKRLEEDGLRVVKQWDIMLDTARMKAFYGWEEVIHVVALEKYLCSCPLLVWLVKGEAAITKLLRIKKGMREDFCDKNDKVHTLFHCSDSPRDFTREYQVLEPQQTMEERPVKTNNQVEVIVFKRAGDSYLFLLLKRNPKKGGFWQPITGNVEVGETFEAATLRELREETGIQALLRVIPCVHSFTFVDDNRQQYEEVFGVEVDTNQRVMLSAEHTEHCWATAEEAITKYLKYPGNKEGLRKLEKVICGRRQ